MNSQEFKCHLNEHGKYEDPSFPADDTSLYWPSQKNIKPRYWNTIDWGKKKGGYLWKRITELPPGWGGTSTPSLWGKNGVTPLAAL